jgi:hypothetical protein
MMAAALLLFVALFLYWLLPCPPSFPWKGSFLLPNFTPAAGKWSTDMCCTRQFEALTRAAAFCFPSSGCAASKY